MQLNELTFENVHSWPIAIKVLLLILSWLVLIFLFYQIDLSAELQTLRFEKTVANNLKASLQKKQQVWFLLNLSPINLSVQNKALAKQEENLLANQTTGFWINELLQQAKNDGLDVQSFKPQSRVQHEFFYEIPVEMSLLGNYRQIKQFITQLAQQKLFISLNKIDCAIASLDPFNNRLQLNFIISAYSVLEARKTSNKLAIKSAALEIIILPRRDLFAPEAITAQMHVSPLTQFSLYELKMVGTLKKDQQIAALILTPDKHVYCAKRGAEIGRQYGKITTITTNYLLVDVNNLLPQKIFLTTATTQ